jgi:hypothetical protein
VPSTPPFRPPSESVVDRFLRYVRIDTQSQEGAPTVPSTPGQWTLARLLAAELGGLGVERVRVSDTCMVYGMIPGNITTAAPVVGFIAHVDTSPAVSGAHVHPVVHANYRGGDIMLPADSTQVISVARNPVRSRRTKRSASASTRSTSPGLAHRSPTRSTATRSARSTTRRGARASRTSRSAASARIRAPPRG